MVIRVLFLAASLGATVAHADESDKYPTPIWTQQPSLAQQIASTAPTQRKVHCATCGAWYVPPMAIAPDSGFYTLWIDKAAGAADETLYLRKLKPDSTDAWAKFLPITSARRQPGVTEAIRDPDIIPDGFGGVIVAWAQQDVNDYNLYAQRIDDTGAMYWQKPALPLCTAPKDQVHVKLMVDKLGGAFVGWQDQRFGNWNVFIHHVMPGGKLDPHWTESGVQVTFQPRDQYLTTLSADGLGGIWVTWWDQRTGQSELYSAHLDWEGKITTPHPYLWRQFN